MITKELTYTDAKKVIKNILKDLGILPSKVEIFPAEGEDKGSYVIFIKSQKKMNFKEAYNLKLKIREKVKELLGNNFIVSFVA
ncbi:hypothetical protein [Persephonella sp.]